MFRSSRIKRKSRLWSSAEALGFSGARLREAYGAAGPRPTKKTTPPHGFNRSIIYINTKKITIDYLRSNEQAKLALKNKSCQSVLQCQSEKRPQVISRTRQGLFP